MTTRERIPIVLTIAGTDPTGGAGIQVSLAKQGLTRVYFTQPGGSENVYFPPMLRGKRSDRAFGSEYDGCAGGARSSP